MQAFFAADTHRTWLKFVQKRKKETVWCKLSFIHGLLPLEDFIAKNTALDWQDVCSGAKADSQYDGKQLMIPLDINTAMLYYRTDVLEANNMPVPRTMEDLISAASALNGTDFNGDDEGDFGFCMMMKPTSYNGMGIWESILYQSFWSHYLQTHTKKQGWMFNIDTMEPDIEHEGFYMALDALKRLVQTSKPSFFKEKGFQAARDVFLSGRCAFHTEWGDVMFVRDSPISNPEQKVAIAKAFWKEMLSASFFAAVKMSLLIQPNQKAWRNTSHFYVYENVGVAPIPGSRYVWNSTAKKLLQCNSTDNCPHAIGGVKRARGNMH